MLRKALGAEPEADELPLVPWRGRDAFLVFLLVIVATLILAAVKVPRLALVVTAIWGLLTVLRARRFRSTLMLLGPAFRFDLRTFFSAFLGGLLPVCLVTTAAMFVAHVAGLDPSSASGDSFDSPPWTTTSWAMVVGSVVVSPLTEELFFRGLLLQGLRTSFGTRPALVTSAILFGLGHIQDEFAWTLLSVGTAIFAGWIYGRLFILSRNLAQPIVAHSLLNAGLLLLSLAGG